MKVLHLISSAGTYGAESVILTLLGEMRRSGQPCALGVFLNQAQPNLALHEAALEDGFESHLLPCKGQIDTHTVRAIRDLVSQTGANVLHTHGYKADVYGYFALRKSRTPLVATCHNWCDTDFATRAYGALDRFCLRHFAAVAVVSEDVKKRLESAGLQPDKVPLIHNGIDCAPFTEAQRFSASGHSKATVVGFAGRLSSEKGIDLFLEAAEGILKKVPDTRFLVAGDGDERVRSEETIREKNLGHHVTLLGRCEDMPAFYASLDVLLSSSRTEGLPMALMEAMSSGVPVVATAVGDVPELVKDGLTGILVPSGDTYAMQEAVASLLRDDERRKSLGEAAAAWIQQNFSASRMAESYLAFYAKVLGSRAAQQPSEAL